MKEADGDRPVAARPTVHRLRELGAFERTLAVVAIGAIAVTSAALLHTLQVDGWTQVGDEANQIFGAQMAHRNRPLLGDLNTANFYGNPFSHHPGPMPWYVLSPWVRSFGPQTGAWVFALVWNLAAIGTAAWLTYRSGGFRAAAFLFVSSIVAFALAAPGQYASTFFQVLPLLPLLVVLVGSWALARGDTIAFPIVAIASTFVVQSATLNLPLVLLCAAAGTISAAVHLRAGTSVEGRVRWHFGLGVTSIVVLWSPTLWDQFFETGNLTKLMEAEIPHNGLAGLTQLISDGRSALNPLPGEIVLFGVVGLAASLVTRRHDLSIGGDRALALIVVATLAGSAVTAALLPADDVETTHMMWLPFVIVFLATAILIAALGDEPIPRLTQAIGLLCAVLALVFALPLLREPQATKQDHTAMAAVQATIPEILDAVPPGEVSIGFRSGFTGGRIAQGLLPLLADEERIGYLGYDLIARDRPTLVVIRNEQTPWQDGELVAAYQPPTDPYVPTDYLDRVTQWATDHGPIRFVPHGQFQVANIVDGRVPSVCVQDLLDTPDLVLDMPPEVLANLYAAGLVTAPALPLALSNPISLWQAAQPVQVLKLEVPEPRSDDLIFSTSSC